MRQTLAILIGLLAAGPAAAWPPSWLADSATANVYRSTDQGANWQLMGQYRGASPGANVHISMTANSSNHLYVVEAYTNGTTETFSIRKSTDQGATWATVSTPSIGDISTNAHYYIPAVATDVQNRMVCVFLISPTCTGLTVTDRPRTFRSTDGGNTWNYVGPTLLGGGTPYFMGAATCCSSSANATRYCALTSALGGNFVLGCYESISSGSCSNPCCGGMCISQDQGATWGPYDLTARALVTDIYNNVYVWTNCAGSGCVDVDLYRYPNGGATASTWLGSSYLLDPAYPFAAAADNLGVLYSASAATGWTYKSLDMGVTWTAAGLYTTAVNSTASIAMVGDVALIPPGAATATPTPAVSLTTSSRRASHEGTLRIVPNPLRGGGALFQFRPSERAVVAILDPAGMRVTVVAPSDVNAAEGRANWNGRSASGARVARGAYVAVLATERGRESASFAVEK